MDMDKIIRAVAESKREKSINDNSTNLPKQIIPKEILNEPDQTNKMAEKVEYEQTRIVSLNQEHLAKNRIVTFNKNNYLSLGFDILRTQIITKMLKNGWRTMAVTSPIPACGKTMVSINLAMSIAHHTDRTAMLVDFDLRRPTVSKYLGLSTGPSLNDVLSDDASVAESLVNPGLDRFVVLPTLQPVQQSSEVLSSQKIVNLIHEFRDRYAERIVMFDLPPILSTDDAMIMISQVDCVLVVVGNGMVSKTDLEESMRYIDQNKLLGTVLNKVNISRSQNNYYEY